MNKSVVLLSLIEAVPKKKISFSGGKRHNVMKCPPGFKKTNGGRTCTKETSQEVRRRKVAMKKAVRTRRSHKTQTMRKRHQTMMRRRAAGL